MVISHGNDKVVWKSERDNLMRSKNEVVEKFDDLSR